MVLLSFLITPSHLPVLPMQKASIKGLVTFRRRKNMPIIAFLCLFLLLFLVVNAMHSIKIYFVYSTSIGPFLFIGMIIIVMIFLYVKDQ